mmetsp:Transcript_7351/g.18694  ORF Transcript_7351/g.18694 Transcript_7351/m.18694 type:complete len:259 (+) Transcript_7351:1128-1904(+)
MEPVRGVNVHVHERHVVQGDRVQLLLRARGHVRQRLARGVRVLHHVLDRRLEVERLDQRALPQRRGVAHALHLQPVRGAPHAQLRVLPHAPLNDLRQVLEAGPELLHAVVAQRDVVRQVRLVPQRLLRVHEPLSGLLEVPLLEQHASQVDHDVGVLGGALLQLGAARRGVVLLERDGRLQVAHAERVRLVLDLLRHLQRLGVRRRLVQRLRVVHLVALHLGMQPRELVVQRRGLIVVPDVVAAVPEQGQRGAALGVVG